MENCLGHHLLDVFLVVLIMPPTSKLPLIAVSPVGLSVRPILLYPFQITNSFKTPHITPVIHGVVDAAVVQNETTLIRCS